MPPTNDGLLHANDVTSLRAFAQQSRDLGYEGLQCIHPKHLPVIHEIFTRLNSTFITPLDPEDIHSLSLKILLLWLIDSTLIHLLLLLCS